uniref:Uncharacterized protein n=1 Tax=Trichogramma kaykai TaxID=54128 RepID=A0ABD2XCE8_9HYME
MDAMSLDEESTFDDYDSEEYYGQVNEEKLRELRERKRDFYSLIRDWKGRLPNLRDVFRGAEIDQLVR